MSAAADRALYGLAYWWRRGDTDMVDQLAAALSEPERAEARSVLGVPGVAETLRTLPEDELRARMLALAGKSREAHVSKPQREVTTILPGGRGVPTIVVREPGWEQQAAAEREAQRRAETDAEVKRIERERAIRESPFTPRPPLVPKDPVAQVYADWERQKWLDECAELRDVPRKQAELEEWARKVELERAMAPRTRRRRCGMGGRCRRRSWRMRSSKPPGRPSRPARRRDAVTATPAAPAAGSGV
jgi:hypothetical protein